MFLESGFRDHLDSTDPDQVRLFKSCSSFQSIVISALLHHVTFASVSSNRKGLYCGGPLSMVSIFSLINYFL